MLILELWGISYQAVVVFGLGKDLLFKSVLGHCETENDGEVISYVISETQLEDRMLIKVRPFN